MKFAHFLVLSMCPASFAFAQQLGEKDPKPLGASDQLTRFKVPAGFEVQLVADETQIQKPININFDTAGRLWVSGSHHYPWPAATDAAGNRIPDFEKAYDAIAGAFGAKGKAPPFSEQANDTVRVLSDFGPDGRARNVRVFADKLNIPSGIQPLAVAAVYDRRTPSTEQKSATVTDRRYKGDSAIIYSIPNIWLMTDTDGDGAADKREVLYGPFGFLDTHGGSSSYNYWIDGWIYGTHGFRNHSEVKDRAGNVTIFDSGNTYRFRPDGSKIEYWSHGQTNPFGLCFDPLGNLYSADCHSKPVYLLLRGGYYEGLGKQHDGLGFAPAITNDDHGSTGICGIACYAAEQFPAEFRDNLFIGNCVTGRINRDKLEWHGSTPKAIRQPDFLTCDDPWFRPVDVKLGPDGALYIVDFYNYIIGHYEVPLIDPRRDNTRGRIWRVVYRGDTRPPQGSAPVPGAASGVSPDAPAGKPVEANRTDLKAKVSRETRETARETRALPMPDLTKLDAEGLVEKLGDSNLTVRVLATHELVERVGKDALPPLRKILTSEVFPGVPTGEQKEPKHPSGKSETAWQRAYGRLAFYRLAQPKIATKDYELFSQARYRAEDLSRVLAFKLTGEKQQWDDADAGLILHTLTSDAPPIVRRAAWEAFTNSPKDSLGPDPLVLVRDLDKKDAQLVYQAKVALREYLKHPGALELISQTQPEVEIILDALLAVPTAPAAEFLLKYLERTKLTGPRIGEFLRHITLYLPAERFSAIGRLIELSNDAPLGQRLDIADNLSQAMRQRGINFPKEISTWTERAILGTLTSSDEATLTRAIEAVREMKSDEKYAPLVRIIQDSKRPGPLRAAALDAVANIDRGTEALIAALNDPSSMTSRKRAAELLGQKCGAGFQPAIKTKNASGDACATLLAALPTAPWELATTIAAGLVQHDASCEALFALIESGKASPALLRHKTVAAPLAQRSAALKGRAAALTRDLPPEDARLDALIAQRVNEYRAAQPEANHGAQIFQQTCAACHKVNNVGGNLAPNLDGVAVRGLHRLLEDILDPNRNVDPAFAQVIIETTDGQMFAGVGPRVEGELVVMNDAQGKPVSVARKQIKTQTQSRLSLMPPNFEQVLSSKDLSDLVAYLLTQSSAPAK